MAPTERNQSRDHAAPRGRLAVQHGRPTPRRDGKPLERSACRVSAELTEAGDLKVDISGRVEYTADGHVGSSLSTADIPPAHLKAIKDALEAALDEAHDDLKEELARECQLALAVHPKEQS